MQQNKIKFDDVRQEDVYDFVGNIYNDLNERIDLTDFQSDDLFNRILSLLEEFFNFPDYRNYN